jgi:putative ABC transport system permease protein
MFTRIKNTLFAQEQARERAEEEVAFHLEMRQKELMERGLSERQAALQARKQYGNVLQQQEAASDSDLLDGLSGVLRDVKVANRRLRRSPLFLVSSVLLLAVGLGVNAAVFSVLDTLFLRGLPFPNADRLVVLEESQNGKPSNSNPQRLADWRSKVSAIESAASFYGESMQLRQQDGNRSVQTLRIAGDWIGMLGARIVEGRNFDAEELRGGKFALLTKASRNLARVGDTVRLGADSFLVVGIADDAATLSQDIDFILPMAEGFLTGSRKAGFIPVIARLKPGVSYTAAQAEAESIAEQLARQYPDTDRGRSVRIVGAQEAWTIEAREPALYIQGAAALLLLITLVNLAGLLAARAMERRKEDTIRLFLGAGKWHLIRLHLVESGLLVFMGCAVALLVAPWTLALLQLNYGDDLAAIKSAAIDGRVLGFLLGVGVVCTLLFASVMAWQTAREKDPKGTLQFRFRSVLVVTEAALGLVLLAVAFQLVHDFSELRFAPLGFREQGLVSARAYLSWETDPAVLKASIARGLEETAALAGVSAVAVVDRLPLEGGSQDGAVFIEGQAEKTRETVGQRMASNNYFALMNIPLIQGQLPTDETGILVNETFSKRFLQPNPIGKNVSKDGKQWLRVAGVVGDVRYSSRDGKGRPEIFLSEKSQYWPMLTYVIQTSQPASNLAQPLRRLWSKINADADFRGVSSLENRIDEIVAQPRRQRNVVAVFGLLALLLVVAGVYGIMAGEMLRRRRELGIRIAVGANRFDIVRIGLERATLLSVIACLVGSLLVASLLNSWVSTSAILIGVLAVATGMIVAGLIPAWKSSRVDPMQALRQD